MKSQARLSTIRARYLTRFASLASLAVISSTNSSQGVPASVSPSSLSSPSLPSLPSLSPVKSVHVWRKTVKQDDASEALPSGFVPSPVEPFSPLVSREMLAEVEPIAYAESLPEIGARNLSHAVNCMLIALPWRG